MSFLWQLFKPDIPYSPQRTQWQNWNNPLAILGCYIIPTSIFIIITVIRIDLKKKIKMHGHLTLIMSLWGTQNRINQNGNDRSQLSLHGCLWLTFVLDDRFDSISRESAVKSFEWIYLLMCWQHYRFHARTLKSSLKQMCFGCVLHHFYWWPCLKSLLILSHLACQ